MVWNIISLIKIYLVIKLVSLTIPLLIAFFFLKDFFLTLFMAWIGG